MKNFKVILIVALIASNGFFIWKSSRHTASNCPDYCDNTKRVVDSPTLGGGLPISVHEAQAALDTFKARIDTLNNNAVKYHIAPLHFASGYWLSKKAIDSLFNYNLTANGMFCNFAFDRSRDSVNLVFSVDRKDNVLIEKASTTTNQSMFISQSLCPDECGPISVETN